MEKKCADCGIVKAVAEFDKHKPGDRVGCYRAACKPCWKVRMKAYRDANPEMIRRRNLSSYQKLPPEQRKLYARKRYWTKIKGMPPDPTGQYRIKTRLLTPEERAENSKRSVKKSLMKRKFGFANLEAYEDFLWDNGLSCGACRTDTPGGTGQFPIDHCHRTGKIRGILCNSCNLALGLVKDDMGRLQDLMVYLAKSQTKEGERPEIVWLDFGDVDLVVLGGLSLPEEAPPAASPEPPADSPEAGVGRSASEDQDEPREPS